MKCYWPAIVLLIGHSSIAGAQQKPRLDADGRPLPTGAVARLGSARFVAPGIIKAVAVSPDGATIATASGADVHFWDVAKARIVREFKTGIRVLDAVPHSPDFRLQWSRNGRLLGVLTEDGVIRILDATTAEERWRKTTQRYSFPAVAERSPSWGWGHEDLRFVDDDRVLVVTLDSKHVELWDVARGAHIRTWKVDGEKRAHVKGLETPDYINVTLSPAGSRMVWAVWPQGEPRRSRALIYATVSGKLLRDVKDLPAARRIDLLDEGDTLLTQNWSEDDRIQAPVYIVRIGDRRETVELNMPANRVHDHELHHNNKLRLQPRLFGKALWLQDKFGLTRWNPTNVKLLDQLNPGFRDLAVSGDGARIVGSRGRRLYVCDGDVDALYKTNDFWDNPRQIVFQADGTLRAKSETTQYPGGRVTVYDPIKWTVLSSRVTPVQYRMAPGRMDAMFRIQVKLDKEAIVVAQVADGKPISRLDVKKELPRDWNAIHVSPDGTRVLTWELVHDEKNDKDKLKAKYRVRWFDTATGRELGRHEIAFRVCYPPQHGYGAEYWQPVHWYADDGSVIGYTKLDSRLALIDCRTGKLQRTIGFSVPRTWQETKKGWGTLPAWSFSSAGFDRLFWGTNWSDEVNRERAVWDRDGNLLRRFALGKVGGILSADGRIIASRRYSTITFYETATGRKIGDLNTGSANVPYSNLAYSPDSKLLAINSADTSILVFDVNRQLSPRPRLPEPKDKTEAASLWERLGDADPAEANPALWALVRVPERALALLKDKLAPAKEKEAGLFEDPHKPPACLRELRALEILERIGTPEARKLVDAVSAGHADALLTREARGILSRWLAKRLVP